MSLRTSIFGLIIYGGVCPDSGVILENALEGTFDNTPNTHSWSGSLGMMGRTRGGEHVTSDDMFKASEINRRTAEAVKREKDKKGWVDYHHRCKAALPILDCLENEMKNDVGWLTSKELEALLRWKGVSVSKKGNVASRRILYQQFAEGGLEEVSSPALWTDEDNQTELNALRNAPIEMADTSYGCSLAQQKRDVERAYQKMSDQEKVDFKQKMAEIDAAGANDMQSASSSLTPV